MATCGKKYDLEKHKDVKRAISFPQAKEIHISEAYRKQDGNTEIIGWQVRGKLAQRYEYQKYPFDTNLHQG